MIQIPLSEEEFKTKAAKLADQYGITLGREGTFEKMGVKASYLYDNGELKITIMDKPFLITEEMCEKQIRALI